MSHELKKKIVSADIQSSDNLVLEVFRYQAVHCPIYQEYLDYLAVDPDAIETVEKIPLIPISVFKSNLVQTGSWEPVSIFTSSTTSGDIPSKHLVKDLAWYHQTALRCFQTTYGLPRDYRFLALLPSYLERSGSSLIEMARYFISLSAYPDSGFFLYEEELLREAILKGEINEVPTILIGVSFALLDFAEKYAFDLQHTIVMETGGMKGRKKEIPREELHQIIGNSFGLDAVHSEYGMTELFSQFYSPGNGIFYENSMARVEIKELSDPLSPENDGKVGMLGVIDLGNIDTCSFILTDDLGYKLPDQGFSVVGRADHSEIRGCNLMVSDL